MQNLHYFTLSLSILFGSYLAHSVIRFLLNLVLKLTKCYELDCDVTLAKVSCYDVNKEK